ncbi:MAG: GTPase HflX [Acidobacteria bacterium]|nr:GTPase HflX [Acidobacteriota bacterium]
MAVRTSRGYQQEKDERAALVGLIGGARSGGVPEHALDELAGLATAAGALVVLRVLQDRAKPNPATFLGKGKVSELAAACSDAGIDVVIFDNELTPAQRRNLEEALGRKVLDRTQLILDIFAQRARTAEGKLQVELAQLKYLLPRLVGLGLELSRLGGGIGTRGPGETKLETDRRRIRQRISTLARQIEAVRRRRAHLRERRKKTALPVIALVGYTNAGKTTVFNRLTRERAEASDALFVTLDPLLRKVRLPDAREMLLSDTVGFIDRLPHALVAAFHATLEEVVEADLLLHVISASSPDREAQAAAVRRVLEEVGAPGVPVIDAFNKCDAIEAAEARRVRAQHPASACISARTGEGVEELREMIADRLALDTRRVTFEFDGSNEADRARVAALYRRARVVRHLAVDGRISIDADVPRRLLDRLESSTRTRQRPRVIG